MSLQLPDDHLDDRQHAQNAILVYSTAEQLLPLPIPDIVDTSRGNDHLEAWLFRLAFSSCYHSWDQPLWNTQEVITV